MHGYQKDDARAFDYQITKLPGIANMPVRGPITDPLPEKYGVAIGAAQTFGRFVAKPYPAILAEELGLPVLNLGVSGAGPTSFSERPGVMAIINNAEFAIVQMMSGRSLSNSVFECGQDNQGVARLRRRNDAPFQFAEIEYAQYMQTATPDQLLRLREEIRELYVAQMTRFLRQIKPPKILLYWSQRWPGAGNGSLEDVHNYWGAFPHFVNQAVVEQLKPHASVYVASVSSNGLPEPIFDPVTGEPLLVWPEKQFPAVRYRHHNNYYPSKQMHEEVAEALAPALAQVLKKRELSSTNAVRP